MSQRTRSDLFALNFRNEEEIFLQISGLRWAEFMPVTNPANLQGSDHMIVGLGGQCRIHGWWVKISESILQSTMLKLRQRAWLMTIFVVVFLYLYVYTFVFSIFHSASFCAESRSNRLAGGVA